MGNYQEYLKMMPSPLREIDPDQPKRLHTFGNPFKQDKKVSVFRCRGARRRAESAPLTPNASAAPQGMMIDEADEFVAGPQNKKRGMSSDSNSNATMKRRRSMSPLLRRPQTPLGNNHAATGKSLSGVQTPQSLLKPAPQLKGTTNVLFGSVGRIRTGGHVIPSVGGGSCTMVTESNGDGVSELDSTESWQNEMDADPEHPSPLGLEEKPVAANQEEDVGVAEERPPPDPLEDPPPEIKLTFERLSPQSEPDDADIDADADVALETIFIAPLDGSQAELRSQVIKEVRKPGRSEYRVIAESAHLHPDVRTDSVVDLQTTRRSSVCCSR